MWIVFAVFAVLWFVSIEFNFPPAVTIVFFAAALGSAATAMFAAQRTQIKEKRSQ